MQPPVQLEDSTEEYEVEKIIARRVNRGSEEFLIRWKGYGSYDDTWEPRTNLKNAKEKLNEFLGKGKEK